MRGGSTIAQQTAKNLFLWPGRSIVRKVLEFPLAIWLDLVLGKRRLMEIYLNIAEWGPTGEFGAEAGARRAFGKPARELGPREAGLLAAMLPNPHRRSAGRPGPGVRRLGDIYEARARNAAAAACLTRPTSALAMTVSILYKPAFPINRAFGCHWAPGLTTRRPRWLFRNEKPRRPAAACAVPPMR